MLQKENEQCRKENEIILRGESIIRILGNEKTHA